MDPKRQFASPYLYVGNGVNSINGVDDTGNYMTRKRGGSWEVKTVSSAEATLGVVARDVSAVGLAAGALAVGVLGGAEAAGAATALTISSALIGPAKGLAQQSAPETGISTLETGSSLSMLPASSTASGITGFLFSMFDLVRGVDDISSKIDSKECIDAFDSRMISNGGKDYNSFPSEKDAISYMNKIPECRIDDEN